MNAKKGLPPNRNQWEIWSREAVQGLQQCQFRRASASSGNVGSESHDLDLEASTGKPVAMYQKSEPSEEGDRMWNSQERHTDAKSMASTEGPVAWNSNQMQNS